MERPFKVKEYLLTCFQMDRISLDEIVREVSSPKFESIPYDGRKTLEKDEYLLKIKGSPLDSDNPPVGFLTKLTQKGEIPVSFKDWPKLYGKKLDCPIYIFREEFREGWKILYAWPGKSQRWGRVVHPLGFVLEIYLEMPYNKKKPSNYMSLFDIITQCEMNKGLITGEFKWQDNFLVMK